MKRKIDRRVVFDIKEGIVVIYCGSVLDSVLSTSGIK
jgi:hypothetical protein